MKNLSPFLAALFWMARLFSAEDELAQTYFIAIKKNDAGLERALSSLDSYVPLLPPDRHFYADPMLFKHNGVNYIFFEDFDYKKGVIVYVTVDENLQLSQPKKALELTHHVSFPFIFVDEGHIYMIPETAALGEIALYEAVEFPDKWEKKKTLLGDGWFGDPICFKHDGYYWIFAIKDSVADMCIYYSTSLELPFSPHPINEKKMQGRNAGTLFKHKGRMIRPTMDCKKVYGHRVVLNEIIELTPTSFRQKKIGRIEPNWAPYLDGTHAFNIDDDLVVYDGWRRIIKDW